ncbi:hypothetical protein LCL97_05690 [Seohaeicola saemankumensis]|nr:sulfotransferase [Seohaeicola saemankumensis]MCA0870305.1 hypothetical protein [Seohaeicola saemankumensis]
MNRLRIFNLGLPKSGTTTLGKALTAAGLKVADWRFRKGQTTDPRLLYGFVGDKLYEGYYQTGDPLHLMPEFDAVTEASVASKGLSLWPQTDWALIDALRRHHPGIKFVLSHRDPADLARSMMGWSNLGRSRLPSQNVPGMPSGYGGNAEQLQRWISGHYTFCRHVFRDDPDFLEYDILDPDAPRRLSDFLGIELSWWGRANAKDRGAEDSLDSGTEAVSSGFGADPARSVILHAGAPCAGTEELQLCLWANRDRLAEQGYDVAYSGRDGAPDGRLRLKLPEPRHKGQAQDQVIVRAAQEIAAQFTRSPRLILSESNVPGRAMHFYSGLFYPGAEQRARALSIALGTPPEHLVFVVRSYDTFFETVHRNRAAQRPVPDFAEFRPLVMAMERGWAEVVAALQGALRPRAMTVVDFDALRSGRDLLARMLPDMTDDDLPDDGPTVHVPTDRALTAIQSAFQAGQKADGEHIRALIAAHAADDADLGFARFLDVERAALCDRYGSDLDRIARMDGVQLIRA